MANRRRVARARETAASHRARPESIIDLAASWRDTPISLRVLRGFLGVTFLYAGLQKLADPGFFRKGSVTYIGGQLQAFAQGTPAGGLLRILDRFPLLTGLGVALGELAIGVAALIGVAEFAAALGGFAVSLVLALSASWHVYPYFLGSDSIYAVAWLSYAVAIRERAPSTPPVRSSAHPRGAALERRELLRGGALAAIVALGATIAGVLGGRRRTVIAALPESSSAPTASTSAPDGGATEAPPAPETRTPSSSDVITTLSALAVGDAIGFEAPDGTPSALVRISDQEVAAFSRVCTHEGCLVHWDGADGILFCPCHGAEFDPKHGAEVLRGPAYLPLAPVDVAVQPNGDITVA